MCVCVCVLHLDLYHRKYSDFTKQKGLHTLFQPKKRNPQPLRAAATRSLKIARSPPLRQVHLVSVSSGFFQRANLRETMRANIKAIAWKLSANQVWLKKRAPLLVPVYVDQIFGRHSSHPNLHLSSFHIKVTSDFGVQLFWAIPGSVFHCNYLEKAMRPSSPSPKTLGETKQDWILPELHEGKASRKFNRSFPKQPWNNLGPRWFVYCLVRCLDSTSHFPAGAFCLIILIWQRCMAPSQAPSQALVTLHHKPHGRRRFKRERWNTKILGLWVLWVQTAYDKIGMVEYQNHKQHPEKKRSNYVQLSNIRWYCITCSHA